MEYDHHYGWYKALANSATFRHITAHLSVDRSGIWNLLT